VSVALGKEDESCSYILATLALCLPVFLANLRVFVCVAHVTFYFSNGCSIFRLLFLQGFLHQVAVQLKTPAAQVPEQISSLSQWDPVALPKQMDDLKAANAIKSFTLSLANSSLARSNF
jgi:hypothetical protein